MNDNVKSPDDTLVSAENDRPAILIAFGDLQSSHGLVQASRVKRMLFDQKIWFVPKNNKSMIAGAKILFYQRSMGAIATADLIGVGRPSKEDAGALYQLGLSHFEVKLDIANVDEFLEPVSFRPLVEQLGFLTNKKYWGTSLRFASRSIPTPDLEIILKART